MYIHVADMLRGNVVLHNPKWKCNILHVDCCKHVHMHNALDSIMHWIQLRLSHTCISRDYNCNRLQTWANIHKHTCRYMVTHITHQHTHANHIRHYFLTSPCQYEARNDDISQHHQRALKGKVTHRIWKVNVHHKWSTHAATHMGPYAARKLVDVHGDVKDWLMGEKQVRRFAD